MNSHGQVITLAPIDLANSYDLNHGQFASKLMYDDGKMDGADRIGVTCAQGVTDCSPPNPQFQYVTGPNTTLFPAALQYTFADRMFQTNQEPGFPAQQFIIVERPLPLRLVIYLRRENRRGPAGADEDTGCTAPA